MSCGHSESRATVVSGSVCLLLECTNKETAFLIAVRTFRVNDIPWPGGGVDGARGSGTASMVLMVAHRSV